MADRVRRWSEGRRVMPQIHAPKDTEHKRLSYAERKRLDVWPADEGWCSACGQGLIRGKCVPIVHIGSKKKDVSVALCGKCLGRMTAALNGGAT
jgi:hypothetical protein